MRILAFDTATEATTVALDRPPDSAVEARDDPQPGQRPGHVTRLLPLIASVLDESGVGWSDLDRLAVGTGPGTFTGLRIGIATARALASAAKLPLVGVSTLESLARHAQARAAIESCDYVVGVIDARRGEAFAAAWPTARVADPVFPAAALAPDVLAERIGELGGTPLAVGNGALAFRSVLERAGALIPPEDSGLHRVTARIHVQLARDVEPSDQHAVVPEYLRIPDAELNRRAAHVR